jgi:peptidoglycan/xylan/chitin deacetylase (PgdA/CDA1 family)/SAM-dependent methyltransferase
MTTPAIGAVVRCGDLVAGVYRTVSSLLTGTTAARAVAIVADPSTPAMSDAWLAAVASARGLRFLRVPATAPGAAWNAGLGELGPVEFAVCVESGDSLEPSALDTLGRRLSSDPAAGFVTSGIEWIGPGTHRTLTVPFGSTPLDILADPLAVHVSSMFHLSHWQASTGFDEEMPALEYSDFWLRLLDGGGAGIATDAPLLQRRVHARALYRRTWMTADYRRAVDMLFERHWKVAAATPGALLERKEQLVLAEYLRHQTDRARLHEAEQERVRLDARRAEVLAPVPAEWKPGVDLGALARTTPLSYDWGYARGTPADRPIIERYLAAHGGDIRGAVLEVQENDYTRRFGESRVERSDVLDIDVANPRATLIGDLRALNHVPSGAYDCIILTQTLHVIDDMRAVIAECKRLLKEHGVLLATLPCVSRVCLEYGPDADFWRVTAAGARRLFSEVFPAADVETTSYGNPLVNLAFGFGIASEDLPPGAYAADDPYFPMVIGVRAVNRGAARETPSGQRRTEDTRGVVLMYHRVGARGIDPHRLSVSESTFRAQLDWLRTTCSVMSLEELAGGADSGVSARRVAVTFDDGYLDNVTVAMPLLRLAGVPATFFLTTAEGPFPYHYWWDRLAEAILGQPSVPPTLTLDLPSGHKELATATESERLAAHNLVYHEIVRLPASTRDAVLDRITAWAAAPSLSSTDRRMTWTEALELAADGGSAIGAHTVDHLFLPAQPDDVLMRELVESRVTLERLTGRTVDTLAYPFGAVDDRTVAAARGAGYRLAVTCAGGGITSVDEKLALPRVEVTDGPLDRFVAAVERAFDRQAV